MSSSNGDYLHFSEKIVAVRLFIELNFEVFESVGRGTRPHSTSKLETET